MKDINQLLADTVIDLLKSQGYTEKGMVLELAEQLGVRDQVFTREEAAIPDALAASLARGEAPQAIVINVATLLGVDLDTIEGMGRPIANGEIVNTPGGPAEVVILSSEERALLERLLSAASAAA